MDLQKLKPTLVILDLLIHFQTKVLLTINTKSLLQELLLYYWKHKPTWVEFVDIIQLINKVTKTTVIPCTKYKFISRFCDSKLHPTYHIECPDCKQIGFSYNPVAKKPKTFTCLCCKEEKSLENCEILFVTFSLKAQIEKLLQKYKDVLTYPNDNEILSIKDVFDGDIHRNVYKQINGPFLSLNLNTDGAVVHKHSKNSLWPLMYVLNNLPETERFKTNNIPIAGLFFGQNLKIKMYLQSFKNQMSAINDSGGITTPIGNIPVYCLMMLVDLPAKAKVLYMKGHNGYDSCLCCYLHGTPVNKRVKFCYR
jgi:hypothetical protein